MSKIHVTRQIGNTVHVILHYDMPGGNNTAGNSWQACWVNSDNAVTSMTEGVGPGQISIAEKASIEDGSIVEFKITVPVSSSPTIAELNILCDKEISDHQANMALVYANYGLVVA